MTLIDQLEGEPGFATAHLRQPLPRPAAAPSRSAGALGGAGHGETPPDAAASFLNPASPGASSTKLSETTKAALQAAAAGLVSDRAPADADADDAEVAIALHAGTPPARPPRAAADTAADEADVQSLWLRGPEALSKALDGLAQRGEQRSTSAQLDAYEAALREAHEETARLKKEVAALTAALAVSEAALAAAKAGGEDPAAGQVTGNAAGGRAAEEVSLLREENTLLEAQLALLSEKMYGSPAKSAAVERDRLQIALEHEQACRGALDLLSSLMLSRDLP